MFESVVNLIPKYLNQKGLGKHVKIDATLRRTSVILEEIFGAQLSEMCKPTSIKNGVLTIKVRSSTMSQELSVYSEKIIEKLSKDKDLTEIKKIMFRV